MRLLRRIQYLLGVDRAIAFTVFARLWSMGAGVVTILLIARFVSPVEQGYYYTFLSLVAIQVFFELGFAFVVLQMASHERAHLIIKENGSVEGDPVAHERLASIFQTTLRWYSAVSLLMAALLIPIGFCFFYVSQHPSLGIPAWRLPWCLLVVAAAVNLSIDPIFSFLEGCGLIAQVARMRLGQGILGCTLTWAAIVTHHPLYGPPMMLSGMVLGGSIWLIRRRQLLLHLARFRTNQHTVSWIDEIWPFQWKIAISWLGGYFVFQIINPILFMYQGPIVAGKMGMSITITTALGTMALAWMNTKASPFGTLVAKRQFEQLDQIFFRTMKQSIAFLAVACSAVFAGLIVCTHLMPALAGRVLTPWAFALLLAASTANHIVFSEALYLRAHKAEPFWVSGIIFSLVMSIGTYLLGKHGSVNAVAVWYFVAIGVVSPVVATFIFKRKRMQWHLPASDTMARETQRC